MQPEDKKKLDRIEHSVWAYFVKKRAISVVMVIAIIVFGMLAASTLPREIQPEVNIPIAVVSTVLPGANPSDTESLLTEPLEKEIATVSEIKTLSSSSGSGMSMIVLEFEAGSDFDKRVGDVKSAVDRAKGELPDDATEPVVVKAEANDFAIITYSVMGSRGLVELTDVAKKLEMELEKVGGVSKANVVGDQIKQVEVRIDPEKIKLYGLDIMSVANLIKVANANLPLGVVTFDELNYSLRIDNRFTDLEDIRNLPLITFSDEGRTQLLVGDVAQVEEVYPKQNVVTKLSIGGEKSLPAVSVQVYKKAGGNILAIVDETKLRVEEMKKSGEIPADVNIGVTNDNSLFIRSDLGELSRDGMETGIMIFLILLMALGFREGLVAGLSVPLTFLLTFAVMQAFGLTLNSLSLFSLLIGLGITVDTAIVIMQGIHENLRKGIDAEKSSLIAVETYKWPLIVGSLTNMFAFFPMLLVSGIVGEFLKTMPIVISAALIGSLVLNLTIIPAFSSKYLHVERVKVGGTFLERFFEGIGRWVDMRVKGLIESRAKRVVMMLVIGALFVASMALPVTGLLKVELFPQTDQQYFILSVKAPVGLKVSETEKIVKEIEGKLYDVPEIENFLTIIGSNKSPAMTEGFGIDGSSESSNLASVTVNLLPKEERSRQSYVIAAEIEERFENFKKAKVSVTQLKEGPPSEDPITVKLVGDNLDELGDFALEVEDIIGDVAGTKNIKNSLGGGVNEFKYVLDKDALNMHGLSALQVAGTIRSILQGVDLGNIKIDGDDLAFGVKYDLPKEDGYTNLSLDLIQDFEVPTPRGYAVTLGELGKYYFEQSASVIAREDQKEVVKVTSGVEDGYNAVDLTSQIEAKLKAAKVPDGVEVKFGGDLEDVAESFADLYRSMFVGVLLILFALVVQFNSFKQPLIILITLPLALIGVFPGLMLLGLNLSFPAFLGVVALGGIVVNNAIVLIDRINENRGNDVPFRRAIADASSSRFQPIFMTTLSNIVGILPLAMSNEFWGGLGFSIVFGLAFSTVLTLVVIPMFYYMFEVRKARKNGEMME